MDQEDAPQPAAVIFPAPSRQDKHVSELKPCHDENGIFAKGLIGRFHLPISSARFEAEATRFWVPQENGQEKGENSLVLPIC